MTSTGAILAVTGLEDQGRTTVEKKTLALGIPTNQGPTILEKKKDRIDLETARALAGVTMMAMTGAQHTILPGYQLGAANDTEPDGQPTPNADGDDTDADTSEG